MPELTAPRHGREEMFARSLTKTDFDLIVRVIDKWSSGPSAILVHPIFVHELGELAKVVEHETDVVGFLFGFVNGAETKAGYVHLVVVHPELRRRGIATMLLQSFESDCRERGCKRLKAITMPGNDIVISFHQTLGWNSSLVEDYAGPGRSRIVLEKRL